ncbi:MAG: tetratricopeptide repeat protein [candidate division Zixibacteria bacterium]|nr:tetratricopeptide repeat protein [Candidatus Tariuqbacter arcticus]
MTSDNKSIPVSVLAVLITALIIGGCAWHKPSAVEDYSDRPKPHSGMPPRRALEHFINACAFEEGRAYQLALREYRRALLFDSTSAELHFGAARNYYILDMFDSAAVEIQRALKIEPHNPDAIELLGEIRLEQEDWEAAESLYCELSGQFPEETAYQVQLAGIYIKTGRAESALDIFFKIAGESAQRREILERSAALLIVNEYPELALRIFHRIIDENPEDARALYTTGTIFAEMDAPDSALVYFKEAIQKDSSNAQYYLYASFLLNQKGDYQQSESLLLKGIRAVPDQPRLYNLLGSTLQRQGKYEEALEWLYKSIATDSLSTSPYVTIGFIYDELDSVDRAIEIYEAALKVDSTDALVMNNYAYILAETNIRLEEALRLSAKSLEAEPDNPSYLDTMGWLLFRMKDYSEAEKYMRKALEFSQNPIMYIHLGDILRESGQEEEALEAYRQGLQFAPDDLDLKQRLEVR